MIVIRPGLLRTFSITVVAAVFVGQSIVGITWGLPSRRIDKYLFGDGEVWSGEKIYRLAKAEAKFDPTRGADVDVDPITRNRASLPSPRPSPLKEEGVAPIPLTATEEDVAKIYLRYRLYTYQPDEMITMMALAGMRPSRLELDPRLYQYGGLFIYPVGALIKLCGLLGLIDVRSDVVFYLDHPDEFGKFYIVARAYSAVWGLIGVLVVYAIARRIALSRSAGFGAGDAEIRTPSASAGSSPSGAADDRPVACAPGSDSASPTRGGAASAVRSAHRAGVLAALLFTLMPVVVCMSHEGKPHLPGAVLMLLAVYFAMRCAASGNAKVEDRRSKIEKNTARADVGSRQSAIDICPFQGRPEPRRNRQSFWWMCVCCGAAVGMVLSSWPIFVLIPLVAFRAADLSPRARLAHTIKGVAIGLAVYLVTNPYILINAFVNHEVLRSNFGNSLAMYQIARIGEGFVRVVELTIEGATLPIVLLGTAAFVVAVVRKNSMAIPLVVVATLFLLQFVLIGAGKPAEYGRFGIFTNSALAISAGYTLAGQSTGVYRLFRWTALPFVLIWVALFGGLHLRNFWIDTTEDNSRAAAVRFVQPSWTPLTSRDEQLKVVSFAEPAPYNCPPLNFSAGDMYLIATWDQAQRFGPYGAVKLIQPVDRLELRRARIMYPWHRRAKASNTDVYTRTADSPFLCWLAQTPISWANKPFDERLWYLPPRSVWSGSKD
ncbi:MAG: hypothetical protein V1790_17150 [Planctomycetota bacterium]